MMKTILITLMLAAFAFGQSNTAKAKAPVKKADAAVLPAGAKQVSEGVWEHTDAQGKQWVFKQMPFGLTKMSKADLDARTSTSLPEGMSVVEQNGAYKFTRRTPFGEVNYTKKTDELSETERAVVAAMNRKAANKESAAKK